MTRDPAITEDRDFGRAAVALGWVPAPRFLLRRDAVLRRMRTLPRGRVLEIGCGAGSLLADLAKLGFECTAVETAPAARVLAARMLADLPGIVVHDAVRDEWAGRFDYLLSFEVLEHIDDDDGALTGWMRCLRPGGRLLLSVPAHAKRWTATDTWAGHVRRYDRSDFIAMAERAGARVEQCENYGFPLSNLIEPLNAWAHGRALERRAVERRAADGAAVTDAASPNSDIEARDARSGESGVKRTVETRLYPLMASLPGRLIMRTAFGVQHWFRGSSLGNGFVLEGVKP